MMHRSLLLFAVSVSIVVVSLLCGRLVDAFMGVKSLDQELRCPACVAFAAAMRRAAWEAHPAFDKRDRAARRRLLNNDKRCMDILTEAMDILLQRVAPVYFKPPLPEPPLYEGALLFSNKSDAPAGAVPRFWSLQDLYAHRRLQVAEFRSIRAVQERNSDESLMHFMHNEIREEQGDAAEALCYLDLFHSANYTVDEYFVAPEGEGSVQYLSLIGRWADGDQLPPELEEVRRRATLARSMDSPEHTWLTFNILKDTEVDERDALVWANKLCAGKSICGGDAAKAGEPVRDYMKARMPVMPPFSEATMLKQTQGAGGPAAGSGSSATGNDEDKPLMADEEF
jgi:hypothetical protein